MGQKIDILINEYKSAGNYSVEFKAGGGLPSGIYMYQLQVNEFFDVKKMLLLK